jgi:hypothetical protein
MPRAVFLTPGWHETKMKLIPLLCSILFFSTAPSTTPPENMEAGKSPPPFDSARELVENLLGRLQQQNFAGAEELFFPVEPFVPLKKVPNPREYHGMLIKEFQGALAKLSTRVGKPTQLTLESFKPGFCKWKAVGSEYNNIPYWSCYKSKVKAKADAQLIDIEVRTLINWGTRWYITHL